MEYRITCASPLGQLTLSSDGAALTALWLEGQRYFGRTGETWQRSDDLPVFTRAKAWLEQYFAGQRPAAHLLPLSPRGTAFQQEVWQLLCVIPYGTTTTYGDLAAEIARRRGLPRFSAQAVGHAVGRNPLAIMIPCHRVVGSDGNLTGYAGGMERKVWLLQHETVKIVDGKVSRQQ